MRPALLHAIWFGVVCRRALCGDYAGDEWTVPPREGAPCARSVSGTPGQVLQVTACDLVSSMDESAQEPRQGRPPRSSSGVAKAPNMQPAHHVGFVACSSVLVSVQLRGPLIGSGSGGHRSLRGCLGCACAAHRAAGLPTRARAQRRVRLPAHSATPGWRPRCVSGRAGRAGRAPCLSSVGVRRSHPSAPRA